MNANRIDAELEEIKSAVSELIISDAERWEFVRKHIHHWDVTILSDPKLEKDKFIDAEVIILLNGKYYQGPLETVVDHARAAEHNANLHRHQ